MKNKTATVMMASALLTLGNVVNAEECFGVALATSNDCATSVNSCAGHALDDGQKDAYIDMPKGLCEKLVNGSLEPSTDKVGLW